MEPPLFVSACLVGFRCRYDGELKTDENVLRYLADRCWIPVCPEQYAGLPTPRIPMAFAGGTGRDVLGGKARVIQQDGRDVTDPLVKAVQALVCQGKEWKIRYAILKERSPSCGVTQVYVGERRMPGMGVFAALLLETGIRVFSEEQIETGGEGP